MRPKGKHKNYEGTMMSALRYMYFTSVINHTSGCTPTSGEVAMKQSKSYKKLVQGIRAAIRVQHLSKRQREPIGENDMSTETYLSIE